jgi:tetratricopeptide (TPR) repeat protein
VPIDASTHIGQGCDLFHYKDYRAALRCFWNAFRLQPANPVVLYNIARTIDEIDEPLTMGVPMAEDFYVAAANLGNVDAYYQLGILCRHRGRLAESTDYFKAFLKLSATGGIEDEFTLKAKELVEKHTVHVVKKNVSKN